MNFFGMGPMEIILVLVIALLVFGPGRLPEVGSAIGRGIREFRKATQEVQEGISRELQAPSVQATAQKEEPGKASEPGQSPATDASGGEAKPEREERS